MAVLLALVPLPALAQGSPPALARAPAASALPEAEFRDPPTAARAWLAWDWLAGDVSEPSISGVLAWAARSGFGGVTLSRGAASGASVEPGSQAWRAALAHAVREAARLGLGLALEPPVAGPWVPEADRASRLVWSEVELDATEPLSGPIIAPPLALSREIALLAYPAPAEAALPDFLAYAGSGAKLDAAALSDANPASLVEVAGKGEAPPSLIEVFGAPVTVRSATLALAGGSQPIPVRLEASDDGVDWWPLAELTVGPHPATVAFAPVSAQYFRAVLASAGAARANRLRVSTLRLHAEPRVHRFEALAGFDPAPLGVTQAPVAAVGIDPASVVDLTARLRRDGVIDWSPPAGRWRVLRLGTAAVEGAGDALDRLDGDAVRRNLRHLLGDGGGPLALAMPMAGPAVGNWTPRLAERFRQLRGHDPLPWLPVLAGTVVGSQGQSEAFLRDYRRTLAELEASWFEATHAAVARERGMPLLTGGRTPAGASFFVAARNADAALLAGQHQAVALDPQAPGAPMARALADHLARNRLMLRQSRAVADVLVLERGAGTADRPLRHGHGSIASDALGAGWKVAGGDLVAPDGARYKALWLGRGQQRLTVGTLRRLTALASAGATIVGSEPAMDPGLAEDEVEFIALAARLWPGEAQAVVGRGRVVATDDVDAALAGLGVAPDFQAVGATEGTAIAFLHRRFADGESWFVLNRSDGAQTFEARLRIAGKAPELWRPDSGLAEPAAYRIEGNETVVPLALAAGEGVHVVFRRPAMAPAIAIERPEPAPLATLDGPWTVTFQMDRGAPPYVVLPALLPLGRHGDKAVRTFAGIAHYAKVFPAPADWRAGQPLSLELGPLAQAAEVIVNNKPAGTVWRAPWRVEIGALARPGLNQLELRVAVRAGDAGAAGLVGPVTLMAPR